jgi:hypothetical protein
MTNELTNIARETLLGKKITGVRYLTNEEKENLAWYSKCVVITLDDGTLVFPSRDDEGNDAGALYYQNKTGTQLKVLPVIS